MIQKSLIYTLKWLPCIISFFFVNHIKTALLFKIRHFEIFIFLTLSVLIVLSCFLNFKQRKNSFIGKTETFLFIIFFVHSVFIFSNSCIQFKHYKSYVLNTEPSQLKKIGKHFIIGFKSSRYEDIKKLVGKSAIGGIYLTKRNFEGKNYFEIQKEIEVLQAIQKNNNLPPLIVATDQEGGLVSRVSPPLTRLPSLSYLVSHCTSGSELNLKVKEYAHMQAVELAELGINVNFSPVVDIKNSNIHHVANLHTRVDQRAISDDRKVVTEVAGIYSRILEENGVIPTLKHFPGLGEIKEDTHLLTGTSSRDYDYLRENDWVPFREISKKTGAFIMLGHVLLNKIDNENLVSCSEKIINGIIRKKWKHNGILITDDLNMGPVAKSSQGIGGTSVKALNAGVDLLLLSYDGEQYYKAVYDVITAEKKGKLSRQRLKESEKRIAEVFNK